MEPAGDTYRIEGSQMGAVDRGANAKITPTEDGSRGKVQCQFCATVDDEVIVRRVTTVEVLVSREDLDTVQSAGTDVGVGEVDPARKLILQLVPKANFETVGESRGEFDPPALGQLLQCYFDVRPTHEGTGELWIIARQGQVPLLTLVLKPMIVSFRGTRIGRAEAKTITEMPPPLSKPLHQLTIVERLIGNEISYLYELDCRTLGIFNTFESRRFLGDRAKYVENLYKVIEGYWISSRRDAAAFHEDLRAYGAQLFEELFPEALQRILWDNRDRISSIMVISTEPFIPWEIVHLKEPNQSLPGEMGFLGQLGLVRWLHGNWPPETLQLVDDRTRYIIPDYPAREWKLPQAQKEIPFLQTRFSATAVQPEKTHVRNLLAQGAFDLLHFAGHGTAEQGNIANARIMLEGRFEGTTYIPEYLDATTVKQHARFGPSRPIVVLNACQVGRFGYQLTGIGGFAQAFLERGAGAFVGSLWSVGDHPARVFTETWYDALLAGSTLADATIRARAAARAAGDATWLAYAVYGHPHATLVHRR